LKAINLNSIENPFEVSYKIKNSIEKVEDKIIISPFCNATMTENPLKQPARSYPVDMTYKKVRRFQSTIKIPDGYKLLVKPDNLNIENNLVNIKFASEIQDNGIIKIAGVYEFKTDVYTSSDYVDLKGYFNKIIDKFNEKLVLVKI